MLKNSFNYTPHSSTPIQGLEPLPLSVFHNLCVCVIDNIYVCVITKAVGRTEITPKNRKHGIDRKGERSRYTLRK